MMQAILSQEPTESRVLYLSEDISNCSTAEICKQILEINEVDRKGVEKFRDYTIKPIQLHIQSFGGSVYDMWALIDIIESSNTPVITYCSGYCMSAAALIFLAGHVRCMYKNSYLMFHQMYVYNFGKFKDSEIEQDHLKKLHKQMIKYLKSKADFPDDFYEKMGDLKQDIYLNAKKCKKYGVCDTIVDTSDWRPTLLEQLGEEECKCEDCEEE